MRFARSVLLALAALIQIHCSPAGPSLPVPEACESLPRVDRNPRWDPRDLAGEYRITWVSDAAPATAQWLDRLWLWPTSMRDSSVTQHRSAAPGDTVTHPLYGVMRPDSGRLDESQAKELRETIDPIYPPVLLNVSRSGFAWLPDNPWAVLLIGTAGNRRDGTLSLDGVGMGMRILEANAQGFRGNFGRWGIAMTDSGHFCAQRMRP